MLHNLNASAHLLLFNFLIGIRLGLQQLWSGGLWLHGEPAHTPQSVQLPAEQGGCEHRLWADLVSSSGG